MRPSAVLAARGLALFLGAFAVANVVGGAVAPGSDATGFDATVWWLDVRGVAPPVAAAAIAATGALLVAWAIVPRAGPFRRAATRAVLWASAAVAAANAGTVWMLGARGAVEVFPLPVSAFVAAALVAIDRAVARPVSAGPTRPGGPAWHVAAAAAVWAAGFALVQMLSFGGTDYARPADAIVVFGARAYADGRPSRALADRVRTACRLWREGRAPLLVLSGGPGDGDVHETDAMAALARAEGVPAAAIVLDRAGTSTRDTVTNAASALRARGLRSALAVSHGYHLPRVKMAFDRAGFAAFTVPARESRRIAKMPLLVAREVAAFWAYWLAPGAAPPSGAGLTRR